MTNETEKKVGRDMMEDLIPGRKQKREAKEAADARARSYTSGYGYSNRDSRGYSNYNWSRRDDRQYGLYDRDDDGLDPLDDGYNGYKKPSYGYSGSSYSSSHSATNRYPGSVGTGKTGTQKMEAIGWDWKQEFTATHGVIEQDRLNKITTILSDEVADMLDSANLQWGSQSGNRLRALLQQFILDECQMYCYSDLHGRGYKPIALLDDDGVVHDDAPNNFEAAKPTPHPEYVPGADYEVDEEGQ